jgi:hypothetical protein
MLGAALNPAQQPLPDGAFSVPMRTGFMQGKLFDPLYSSRCPISFENLREATDELNSAYAKQMPPWLKMLPRILIGTGFCLLFGGIAMSFYDIFASFPEKPGFHFSFLVFIGFAILIGGMCSCFCTFSLYGSAIDAVRQKISELNMRYESQGIDFDLHQSRHLQMHTTMAPQHRMQGFDDDFDDGFGRYNDRRRTEVRTVTTYTLVIQNLNQVGDNRIPNAQSLQSFGKR